MKRFFSDIDEIEACRDQIIVALVDHTKIFGDSHYKYFGLWVYYCDDYKLIGIDDVKRWKEDVEYDGDNEVALALTKSPNFLKFLQNHESDDVRFAVILKIFYLLILYIYIYVIIIIYIIFNIYHYKKNRRTKTKTRMMMRMRMRMRRKRRRKRRMIKGGDE